MPCGHTRTSSNVTKVADRRSRISFKRPLDHNNHKFSPKECEVPGLVFRNSEQRWIILTLVALEPNAYWKLAPFLPPLQGADQKNHVGSGASSDMDGPESSSPPPAIIFQVGLPEEKKINRLEHTDSAKPLPICSSSGGVVPRGVKTMKRSARKKGKKKGKQYKQGTSKKVSTGLGIQHEQNICVPSTTNSDLVCLGEDMSENSVSEKATSTSLSIEDTSVEKDDSDNNHEYADSSTTLLSCPSYSDAMVESDQAASLSQERAGEKSSCNGTASMNNAGCIGNSCWSKDVVNACSSIQRAPCSSQAYNSNDFHLVISGRRGRRARTMAGGASQNVPNRFHGVTGKENNHSVWQKVQKIDMEACICETETVNAVSPQDNSPSKHSNIRIRYGTSVGLKQNQSGKTCRVACSDEVEKPAEACICETETVIAVSPQDNSPSKHSNIRIRYGTSVGLKQNQSGKTCRVACSDEVVKTDLCKATPNIVSTSEVASKWMDGNSMNNVRKKASSAFKQANHYFRKGSYPAKVNMDRVSKNHIPQNEGMPILPQVIHEKHISSGLRPPCSAQFQQFLVAPANKIDHCHRESQQKTDNYIEKVTSSGNSCSTVCGMSLPAAYNDVGASPADSSDQVYIEGTSGIRSAEYSKEELSHTDSEENHCLKLEAESSQNECSKLDSSTGSVLQKWVPVGRKESTMSNMTHLDNTNASTVEDLVPDKLESRRVKSEVSTSKTQYFTPLTRGQFPCSSPRAEEKDFSSVEADQVNSRLRNHPYAAEESGSVLPVSSCQTRKVQNEGFSRFETDLDKILLAVHDAYKFHSAASAYQASGSPLADIERFLYTASPVIGQTHSIGSCRTCSKEQLIGDSMCLCHIPNISLKRLWQWYEEPGCFGLEVKAQEYHNSKRLCNGYSEFSAYFVPYLSAVQLFGRSRNTRNDSTNEAAAIECEAEKTLETPLSNLCSLPILSMLLPQPFNETDTCSSNSSSSSAKYECSNQFYRSTYVGDEELIFEYFESDQPPWRRPLFEKIKELIAGDTLSNDRAFGDPLMLENINLHDLHPASWYSVAWYPIYRIPDGHFHAAFLTYHSLGHFVQQSFYSNASDGLISCIASPVVGLLSYNDKGECWFKLKNSYSKVIRNEEARFFNPSEILKERLRSLKQTATVMARASVSKGNRRSVNRHPDYEFFISRSR